MKTLHIHKAKTHLSRRVDAPSEGHEGVIAMAGKPMAKLMPISFSGRRRKPGYLNGCISPLAVSRTHAAAVMTLPDHHRDPFDRVLIAQAMHEPMRPLTTDAALRPFTDLVDLI